MKTHILVCDDEPSIRELISVALEVLGYVVETADDGAEALMMFRRERERYSLVVTDHKMPRLDGLELVKQLRTHGFAGKIMVLSGSLETADRRAYTVLGVDRIMNKPFGYDEIRQAVQGLLSQDAGQPPSHLPEIPIEWDFSKIAISDWRRLFESLPGLYLVLNPLLKIVAVTDAYCHATQTKREDILGHDLFKIFPDNPADPRATGERNLRDSLARVLKTKATDVMAVQKYDIRTPGETGIVFEERWWSPVNSPLLGPDGEVAFIVHRVEDVTKFVRLKRHGNHYIKQTEALRMETERLESEIFLRAQEIQMVNQQLREANERVQRLLEDATELDKLKSDFFANVSHELRTPLTPVLLMACDMEIDEAIPVDRRAQMRSIRKNIELEARLIDDLLDLTRITHGKFSIQRHNLDANELLSTTLEIMRGEYLGKDIAVQIDAVAHSTEIHADPVRLQQVFWNILKNAIKFTPAGGDIHIRTFNPDPRRLCIEIRDNGIGTAPEFLKELFHPFKQEAAIGKAEFGGLGLGLSLSKTIIEAHGGTITAASAGPNYGATFKIELPLSAEAGAAGIAARPINVSAAPRRILLVEDHEPTRVVLARLLRSDGHRVDAVGSCAEALKATRSQAGEEQFQALLCDIGLPDGSGLDIVRDLKARTPGLSTIAFSGFGTEDDIRRSMEAGFDEHLVKPVSIEELRHALAA